MTKLMINMYTMSKRVVRFIIICGIHIFMDSEGKGKTQI